MNLCIVVLTQGHATVQKIQWIHDQFSEYFQFGNICRYCRNRLYPCRTHFTITDVKLTLNSCLRCSSQSLNKAGSGWQICGILKRLFNQNIANFAATSKISLDEQVLTMRDYCVITFLVTFRNRIGFIYSRRIW